MGGGWGRANRRPRGGGGSLRHGRGSQEGKKEENRQGHWNRLGERKKDNSGPGKESWANGDNEPFFLGGGGGMSLRRGWGRAGE
jgi:hypothetical protein